MVEKLSDSGIGRPDEEAGMIPEVKEENVLILHNSFFPTSTKYLVSTLSVYLPSIVHLKTSS